jgi:hypothetical protein
MATNREVIDAWLAGRPAKAASLSTDGTDLYSYSLRIGTHAGALGAVAFNYTATARPLAVDKNGDPVAMAARQFYSSTTSAHVGLALAAGAQILSAR